MVGVRNEGGGGISKLKTGMVEQLQYLVLCGSKKKHDEAQK